MSVSLFSRTPIASPARPQCAPLTVKLPPSKRSRNIRVFCTAGEGACEIAGFWIHGDISISTFYRWLSLIIEVDSGDGNWVLRNVVDGSILDKASQAVLELGAYYVAGHDNNPLVAIPVSEKHQPRVYSGIGTPHTAERADFREQVFCRDLMCLASKEPFYDPDVTQLHEVAHILAVHHPYAGTQHLLRSLLNGLTLLPNQLRKFDGYSLAVDPDDNYRIIVLTRAFPLRATDNKFLHVPYSSGKFPPETDNLLREHLRQGLLKWCKGADDDQSDYAVFA